MTASATGRLVKDGLYEQFARVGKAVAHPKRIELLDLLCPGELRGEVLADSAAKTLAHTAAPLRWQRGGGGPGSFTDSPTMRCASSSSPCVTWPATGTPRWTGS